MIVCYMKTKYLQLIDRYTYILIKNNVYGVVGLLLLSPTQNCNYNDYT